jgi:hypothetical protein
MALTAPLAAIVVPTTLALSGSAGSSFPPPFSAPILPGNLLVSTSQFQDDPNITAGVTQLPPGCASTVGPCATAVAGGAYPYVFNNDSVDGSFGVTSKIDLEELAPYGFRLGSIEVPNSSQPWVGSGDDQMVTSFSSKSELGLTLSPDGRYVTFMGYDAPIGTSDVSNSNTPGAVDTTNPVGESYYRVVARLGQDGRINFTETNAYSGNNGRNAIYNDAPGADLYYTAGNAGNGANPEPQGVVTGAGAQLIGEADQPESAQTPGAPTPVGSFNVMQQLGFPKEKVAKDDNFRGLAEYDNVLYFTKGSGSNGVDTVYFLDTTGTACPSGSGLPVPGAALPTSSTISFNANEGGTANPGLQPQNMCILKGFPEVSAKNATDANDYPFGMFFANPTTLYVADEGAGDNTYSASTGGPEGQYTAAAASTTAGLQKWVFDSTTGQWNLAYTLQSGLDLGQPYDVPGYPTGLNSGAGGSGLPWAPATDGLRNIAGRVNPDGTVSIWGITSTVSGSGDQGADPNQLVNVTDDLAATTLPSHESFVTLDAPRDRTVYRGVSFTPGTDLRPHGGCGLFCRFLTPDQGLGLG